MSHEGSQQPQTHVLLMKLDQQLSLKHLAKILTTPDVLMYDAIVLNIIDQNHEHLTKTALIFTAVNVCIHVADFSHRKRLGGKLSDGKMKGCFHKGSTNLFVYVC
jgi:hypothetical protein